MGGNFPPLKLKTMETTKHIDKLANKIAIPFYFHNETKEEKEETKKQRVKYIRAELTRIKNALLNGKFYCKVNSVSRSGMSRNVTLAYIYKGKLRTINEKEILELATIKNNKIGGCGMDMLFHAQYSLFNSLFRTYKEAHYQKRMKAYNTIG
tara:strand:+ start:113 stop:568 length:456 start_codon:yes stop_codon:yes gene_type:complete